MDNKNNLLKDNLTKISRISSKYDFINDKLKFQNRCMKNPSLLEYLNNKRKETLCSLLEEFVKNIGELFRLHTRYTICIPDEKEYKDFIQLLDSTSIMIKTINENSKFYERMFGNEYTKFKNDITEIQDIIKQYEQLKTNLNYLSSISPNITSCSPSPSPPNKIN